VQPVARFFEVGSHVASDPWRHVGGAGYTNAGRTELQKGSAPRGCVAEGVTTLGSPSSVTTGSVVPEVSLLAFVDGRRVVPLPLARDHKRLGDGDQGPNTGGMGAYAPVPFVTRRQRDDLCRKLIEPVVALMEEEGFPYQGVLFAGLILTAAGPKVLEFNCRFGDPEAQVSLPLIGEDLLPWLVAVASGALPCQQEVQVNGQKAVGIVLASQGYPDRSEIGKTIRGLAMEAQPIARSFPDAPNQPSEDLLVFHGATSTDKEGKLVTSGGRVLTIVGRGETLEEAGDPAYNSGIEFTGMQQRKDIARSLRTLSPALTSPTHVPGDAQKNVKRIGVLASGGGTNLQAVLDACHSGQIDGTVCVVVSNRGKAGCLDRAKKASVPTKVVPLADRHDSQSRRAFEHQILEVLDEYDLDLIVLAGWMVVLSAEFLAACRCRVINIHPALLPLNDAESLPVNLENCATQAVREPWRY